MDYVKKHLFPIILTIIFLFTLTIVVRVYNSKLDKRDSQISLLTVDNQNYIKVTDELGKEVVKQKAVVVKEREQVKEYSDKYFALKEKPKSVDVFYQEVTKTDWDTAFIPYHDTLYVKIDPIVGDTITQELKNYIDSSVRIPNSFEKDSSLFAIKGRVLKNGVSIDSLSLPDTFNLRVVETKGKLFKPSFVEFQSFHTNPLVNVTGTQSVIYKVPKKTFWQVVLDKLIWVGIGVGATTLIK